MDKLMRLIEVSLFTKRRGDWTFTHEGQQWIISVQPVAPYTNEED